MEASRKVSMQMSSRFVRQEVPQKLTYRSPQHLTYYLPQDLPYYLPQYLTY